MVFAEAVNNMDLFPSTIFSWLVFVCFLTVSGCPDNCVCNEGDVTCWINENDQRIPASEEFFSIKLHGEVSENLRSNLAVFGSTITLFDDACLDLPFCS